MRPCNGYTISKGNFSLEFHCLENSIGVKSSEPKAFTEPFQTKTERLMLPDWHTMLQRNSIGNAVPALETSSKCCVSISLGEATILMCQVLVNSQQKLRLVFIFNCPPERSRGIFVRRIFLIRSLIQLSTIFPIKKSYD